MLFKLRLGPSTHEKIQEKVLYLELRFAIVSAIVIGGAYLIMRAIIYLHIATSVLFGQVDHLNLFFNQRDQSPHVRLGEKLHVCTNLAVNPKIWDS